MEASMKVIKYLLFAFNLLFALSGLALIITGAVVQIKYTRYLDFVNEDHFNTPIILIATGCIIFIVTFFGCCGAVKENHCMTLTFSIMLAFILIVELGAGIAAYVMKSEIHPMILKKMQTSMQNYNDTGYEGVTKTWNTIQHDLKCCGVIDYNDWKNAPFGQSGDVPDACCFSDNAHCGVGILNKPVGVVVNTIHVHGCLSKLEETITENVAIVGGIGIGIALTQFVGVLFACMLARSIRRQYETV